MTKPTSRILPPKISSAEGARRRCEWHLRLTPRKLILCLARSTHRVKGCSKAWNKPLYIEYTISPPLNNHVEGAELTLDLSSDGGARRRCHSHLRLTLCKTQPLCSAPTHGVMECSKQWSKQLYIECIILGPLNTMLATEGGGEGGQGQYQGWGPTPSDRARSRIHV